MTPQILFCTIKKILLDLIRNKMFSNSHKVFKKISPQSKSFLILFSVALLGSYLCLFLASSINFPKFRSQFINNQSHTQVKNGFTEKVTIPETKSAVIHDDQETITLPSTDDWKTYTDSRYNFSFNYPPKWTVKKPTEKYGYYTLVIDPGPKYDNVYIYIGKQGFFAMDNLPKTEETITGKQAQNVEGLLYGIEHDGNYFTFDKGMSVSIMSQFQALVHSTKFLD